MSLCRSSRRVSLLPKHFHTQRRFSTLQNLSDAFLRLPDVLPSQPSYVWSIATLCIALRLGITLPVAIWQRKRTDRMNTIVGPLMQEYALKERFALRDRFRKANRSYEAYQKEFQRLVKTKQKELQKQYKCSPRATVFLPLMVYFPVFIGATMAIREASLRAAQFKTHVISTAMQSKQAGLQYGTLPGLEHLEGSERAATAKQLLTLANEKLLDSLALVETDPHLILPIVVGVALSLNVELSASVRAAFIAARQAEQASATDTAKPPIVQQAIKPMYQIPKLARKPQQNRSQRHYATKTEETSTASKALMSSGSLITNILRVMSVGMIIVATQNPVAVNFYWILSNTFTLIQNGIFAMLDRRK